MEYFISAFWTLLELVVFHYFWSAFLVTKTTKKTYLLSLAGAWILPAIYTLTGLNADYGRMISFAFVALACILNFRGSILQKVLFIILPYIFVAIFDTALLYGSSYLLGISIEDLVWRKVTYTLVATTGKMISILLAWTIFYIRSRKKAEALKQKWLFLTLSFPVISFIIIFAIYFEFRHQEDLSFGLVIINILLVFSNIAIIYLIQLMEKSTIESKKMALLNQQMEIQTSSILALEQNYRTQRKATHEFQNQLQTIRSLITAGDYINAQEYILELQGTQTTRIFSVCSHHPIIDAVLNHKYQLANDSGIDVRVQVNDLSRVSIDTNHIVVLLSNLLDNAIEACLRHDKERIIQCSILASDSLYISIRNTSLPVEINNNKIQTSKEPAEDHGYGLAYIDLILNHLHAEFIRSYNDGWFEFATEIPLAD